MASVVGLVYSEEVGEGYDNCKSSTTDDKGNGNHKRSLIDDPDEKAPERNKKIANQSQGKTTPSGV